MPPRPPRMRSSSYPQYELRNEYPVRLQNGERQQVSPGIVNYQDLTRSSSILKLDSTKNNHDAIKSSPKQTSDPIASKRRQLPTRLSRLIRTLRVQTPFYMFSGILAEDTEEEKIALVKDLLSTCLTSLLHAIPLLVSLAIVILNLQGLYIGRELPGQSGEDSLKFLGLQFAAKILESLVVASLTTIVFDRLRWHLVSEDGVPLGAIAACLQISAVSNLWSPEFVASMSSRFGRFGYQIFFLGTLFVATLLCLVVGPSSATALKPFLNDWPAGGTSFWLNGTSLDLFPPRLEASFVPDYSCFPAGGSPCTSRIWDPVADGLLSFWPRVPEAYNVRPEMVESAYIPGRNSIRSLNTRLVGPFLYNPGISVATVVPATIATATAELCSLWFTSNTDAINRNDRRSFHYYNDIICSTKTLQPATFVRCNANNWASTEQSLSFPSPLDEAIFVSYEDSDINSQEWYISITQNRTRPGLKWVRLQESRMSEESLGAIIAIPNLAGAESTAEQLLSCTIDARWVNTTVEVSFAGGPFIASGSIQRQLLEGLFRDGADIQKYQSIQIDQGWAQGVNAFLPQDKTTVFEKLCRAVGIWDVVNAQEPLHAIEAVLAVMLVQGMGLTGHNSVIQGTLKGLRDSGEWETQLLPTRGVFGNGGDAFDVDSAIQQEFPRQQFAVKVSGYGYGYSNSTLLSVIALLVYILVALGHILYSVSYSRVSSNSWDSISEILTLALQSDKPEILKNTGAGIATLATFKRPVRLVARKRHLELQVGVKGPFVKEHRVEENQAYG